MTAETEDEADERASTEAHEEWAADSYRTEPAEQVWEPGDGPLPPIPDECYPPDAVPLEPIELVPGGGVSRMPGAPGTHQDADGAAEAPAGGVAGAGGVLPGGTSGAAPSAQTPPPLPLAVREPRPAVSGHGAGADAPLLEVGRGGGLDLILWAAVATALVITTVFALVQVARMPNVIGWR